MIHGSLFSGIGGFDLAAEWMGWTNAFHCEIDPWNRKVLHKNFPNATQYDDITTTDFSIWRGKIDIITGGFPCQPYSQAGKRLGKEDARHLWPRMLRVIREVRPTYVVGENVGGLLTWNAGLVFDEVQTDLEATGYEVQSFVLPACGVNAPHKRDRVWIVAHRTNAGLESVRPERQNPTNGFEVTAHSYGNGYGGNNGAQQVGCQKGQSSSLKEERQRVRGDFGGIGATGAYAHTKRLQGKQRYDLTVFGGRAQKAKQISVGGNGSSANWNDWPTQPPLCGGVHGIPAGVDRAKRIKAMGNAVVPQVVYQIFKAIDSTHA